MIEVTNLTKKYGNRLAVNNISFTVNKGEILGFLGPNGAGKSTTMNMLTGYLSATSGTIKINGIDILENPIEAKKHIGYLPELPPLYMDMTVKDYLVFVCKLKKVEKAKIEKELARIMQLTKLTDVSHRIIKNLSKGYKQRVGLAQALVGSPEVLILDEPTVGLDPKQIIEIRNLVKDLSKQHTVILSSHILPEISAVCDRVMIISKGNIVASDTTENLTNRLSGSSQMIIRVTDWSKQFLNAIKSLETVKSVHIDRSREENTMDLLIEAEKGADIRESLFNLCHLQGNTLLMMKPLDVSLEDIFLQVTDNNNTQSIVMEESVSENINKAGDES